MKPVVPPLVAPRVTVARDQDEFQPIVAALVKHPSYPAPWVKPSEIDEPIEMNTMVLAFKPTPEEVLRLSRGEPVLISILTFGQPMQGLMVHVGAKEPADLYSVEIDP